MHNFTDEQLEDFVKSINKEYENTIEELNNKIDELKGVIEDA